MEATTMALLLTALGASSALAMGASGSAIGVAIAVFAGLAVITEDRRQMRNVIVLASLPMTQCFYSFIIFFTILSKVKAATIPLGTASMVAALGAGCGVVELTSAIYQGKAAANAIASLPRVGTMPPEYLMLIVYIELFAILAMVFTLLGFSLIGW